MDCLFVVFMVFLAVQKFLSLIRSHLFTFAFISITLGDRLKKIHFLLISSSVEYHFPSPYFQFVCVPRFEVGLL